MKIKIITWIIVLISLVSVAYAADMCFVNEDCIDLDNNLNQFCEFHDCLAETGECVYTPEQCMTLYEPVCGCDDQTYANDCVRRGNRVSKQYDGVCKENPEPTEAYFRFRKYEGGNTFVFMLNDASKIQEARSILNGSQKDKIHVMGYVFLGGVDYNPGYDYYLEPDSINFFEQAIELCDADIWSSYPKEYCQQYDPGECNWCPWNSELIEEVEFETFYPGERVSAFSQTNNIVISEVLYNPSGPEDKEWIELYNPTNESIDISGWKIYSFSNESADATINSGVIEANGFFLIGDLNWNQEWDNPDYEEGLFLRNSDSGIQLRDNNENIIDTLGWGTNIEHDFYETTPSIIVTEGNSLERTINPDCSVVDTNNSLDDYNEKTNPFPRNSNIVCEPEFCGDNEITWNEVCEPTDLDGKTCQDFNYSNPGGLTCSNTCFSFNISNCNNVCGDNNIEPGEECDDGNLVDADGCSANCELELLNCGNNIKEGLEICDGNDLNGKTCQDYGYSDPETLTCNVNCLDFDVSGCNYVCGDNNLEPDEECDDGNLIDGDGCDSLCQSEITDDLQVNYIRGKITIDGVTALNTIPYTIEILSGENVGSNYSGIVDNNIPIFLQGNGDFDTKDQLIFNTGNGFEVSVPYCNNTYQGVFANGGNGDFTNNIIEMSFTAPPVVNSFYYAPLNPTELDDITFFLNTSDNYGGYIVGTPLFYNITDTSGVITNSSVRFTDVYEATIYPLRKSGELEAYFKISDNNGNIVHTEHLIIYVSPTDKDNDNFTSDVDCDDNNSLINPNATEICDDIDNDCNANTSDGSGEQAPLNNNQLGVCQGSAQLCIQGNWTEDYSQVMNFEFPEITCDGLDNNCNNETDENLTTTYYQDSDGDSYGDSIPYQLCNFTQGYVENNSDCNDTNENINPEMNETCNGFDDNCDLQIDEGFPNFDNDSMADCVDEDDDNDGVSDDNDDYPFDPNRWTDFIGDLNGDNEVNILDLIIARNALNSVPGDPNWLEEADVNLDDKIDILDLIIIRNNIS